jgi:hypothetical protein
LQRDARVEFERIERQGLKTFSAVGVVRLALAIRNQGARLIVQRALEVDFIRREIFDDLVAARREIFNDLIAARRARSVLGRT